MTMDWRRFVRLVGTSLSNGAWWATIGPICVASDLTELGMSVRRPLTLSGELDNYPITELLGRLLAFRDQLRLARAVFILSRSVLIGAVLLLFAKFVEVASGRPQTPWLTLVIFIIVGWSVY